jgi:hypothetical protein
MEHERTTNILVSYQRVQKRKLQCLTRKEGATYESTEQGTVLGGLLGGSAAMEKSL